MSNVISIWEAKHKLDGKKNLKEFIHYAKVKLTLYSEQGWESSKWKPNKGQTLVFGFQDQNYGPIEEFKKPFMDFAKAFIRQQMTIKEISSAHLWIALFRLFYNALLEQEPRKAPCILNISNLTIKNVEQQIRESKYVPMRKYHIGS